MRWRREPQKVDAEKNKTDEKKRICVAAAGGIVLYGSKELLALGYGALRGRGAAALFAEGASAAAASKVILGVVAAGVVTYVADKATNGAITKALAPYTDCGK